MKSLSLILIVTVATTVRSEKFTTKYDNFDLDEILKSDRLLGNYFNCIMEKGPCTAEGTELKKNLPEGLKTDCGPCSDKQKESVKKVIIFLAKNKAEMFKELREKYDPEGIYKSRHADDLAKEGIML